MREKERIVLPQAFLNSILTVFHIKLNQLITLIRLSKVMKVRVDKASGFASLHKSEEPDLANLGIDLELADDENKNSNCPVDSHSRTGI